MIVPLLQAIGIGLGVGLLVLLLGMLVFLLIAFTQMGWVALVQWRDVFSFDRWTEVLITIGRSKLRTALTLISVAWGIFVLVLLLGLGRGLNNGARNEFSRDAENSVWINANKTSVPFAGYDLGRKITFDNRDYDEAKQVRGVEHSSGRYFIKGGPFGGGEMLTKRGGKASAFGINAVHPGAFYMNKHDIVQGRFLSDLDIEQRRKVAVISKTIVEFLFPDGGNPLGQWIEVAGVPFQVVGVFSDTSVEQERQLYIPVSTAQLAFNGADRINAIEFTAGTQNAAETKAMIDEIVGQLAERHRFDPKDPQAVRVHNSVEAFERFQAIFFMISAFVTFIGLGTLATGVVGVSNIMMIAVKERTKEIGVRKALGATPTSIVFMIVQESVFLTGIAGLLGLAGGVGLLSVISSAEITGFISNPSIDLNTGVAATLFLMLAGALAGYFPARAAAKVNPIHALRDQ